MDGGARLEHNGRVRRERAIVLRRSIEHWVLLAGAFAGLGLLALLRCFVGPDPRGFGTHTKLGLPDCKTIDWWGVPCPGCGVTTSLSLAAHGRWLESLHNQPLGCALAGAMIVAPALGLWHHVRGRDLRDLAGRTRWKPWVAGLCLLVVGAWAWKLGLVQRWWS